MLIAPFLYHAKSYPKSMSIEAYPLPSIVVTLLYNPEDNSTCVLYMFSFAFFLEIIISPFESSMGMGRLFLSVMLDAYAEDELGGETRVFLKLSPKLAPVKAMVAPLLRNKPELVAKAREVYAVLKKEVMQVVWDDNGNIGKRYRRQDEIGTPFCIVIDFDTLTDDTVTVRDRDTGMQERVKVGELKNYIKEKIV